jgi:ornithine cyclodeaminase
LLIADAAAVARATPWTALIDALGDAFAAAAVVAPPRGHHAVAVPGEPDRTLLLMPAWTADGATVVKLVNVVPGNAARGLPAIQGAVVVADAASGAWRAVLDGGELTARRTAAASALAARRLARPDAATLLVVGTGRLAPELAAAHAAVRPIRRALVWGRRPEAAEAAAARIRAAGLEAVATADLEAAAGAADVIACATLSEAPLVLGRWLRPGLHLDLVGAFRPVMRETDAEAVARATVFVDTIEGARDEAGDLIRAEAEGRFRFADVAADLAALCAGRHPGRRAPDEITLFKSVGTAIEDFAAARLVLARLAA